ncbi:transposase [bacterium]|nr:transposase [bacterium]
MKTNKSHGHTPRLTYWDYSRPGWYFITICTHQRTCFFGDISGGSITLSEMGTIVEEELQRSFELRPELRLDSFVIMPNHLHLIVIIDGPDTGSLGYQRQPGQREPRSVSSFVAALKAAITAKIRALPGCTGLQVWQERFHDHVIRTEGSLNAIRQYIVDNPLKWELDKFHPKARPGSRDELDLLIETDSLNPLPE